MPRRVGFQPLSPLPCPVGEGQRTWAAEAGPATRVMAAAERAAAFLLAATTAACNSLGRIHSRHLTTRRNEIGDDSAPISTHICDTLCGPGVAGTGSHAHTFSRERGFCGRRARDSRLTKRAHSPWRYETIRRRSRARRRGAATADTLFSPSAPSGPSKPWPRQRAWGQHAWQRGPGGRSVERQSEA